QFDQAGEDGDRGGRLVQVHLRDAGEHQVLVLGILVLQPDVPDFLFERGALEHAVGVLQALEQLVEPGIILVGQGTLGQQHPAQQQAQRLFWHQSSSSSSSSSSSPTASTTAPPTFIGAVTTAAATPMVTPAATPTAVETQPESKIRQQ